MQRLCTWRATWNRGTVGNGHRYGAELSVGLVWEPRNLWVGVHWQKDRTNAHGMFVFICLLPCLPIRIHYHRFYGGIAARRNWWGKGKTGSARHIP